ncbi:Oxoglutarate/iron-dependent dioxygenase [Macleaya cordata]|uniref:Oxoglutarate/iron-dependent dioxygenase n=1 Tax=Macleaya cordata TaxID=56857 RepID=A0A200Q369_MACCD|nr:Oxoglutarate/iron-dependent dioxygenase [Macleaya cordata]
MTLGGIVELHYEPAEPSQTEEIIEDSTLTHLDIHEEYECSHDNCDTYSIGSWKDGENGWSEHMVDDDSKTIGSWKDGENGCSEHVVDDNSKTMEAAVNPPNARLSWADMAQEDELQEREEEEEERNKQSLELECSPPEVGRKLPNKPELSRERREYIRFMNVQRKKDFICLERINGKIVNVVDGLELHAGVFSAVEQKRIVDLVFDLQEKGRKGELRERTYSAPQKWMRGKGRVTIQFGCCYNYAQDRNGNPPGILRNELVDPIPDLFKKIIRRLVQWHVLPPSCVPDSCIVNIYEEGDCIPPHIDNHDFVRPFCTVSFLSECNIVFGSNLKIVGPGEFDGSFFIPLPVGSVLVLNGNGADVAKHCVPAVPTKRISITFRKMDEAKHPIGFIPEPDLQGIQPLPYDPDESKRSTPLKSPLSVRRQPVISEGKSERRGFIGRGSYSEIREGNSERRGLLGRGNHSEIREPNSNRRGILGRGGHSEIREGNSERNGLLGRGSHSEIREGDSERRGLFGRESYSEPRHTAQTRPQQRNWPRVRLS